jgi:hypothetical protein
MSLFTGLSLQAPDTVFAILHGTLIVREIARAGEAGGPRPTLHATRAWASAASCGRPLPLLLSQSGERRDHTLIQGASRQCSPAARRGAVLNGRPTQRVRAT